MPINFLVPAVESLFRFRCVALFDCNKKVSKIDFCRFENVLWVLGFSCVALCLSLVPLRNFFQILYEQLSSHCDSGK